MPISLKDGLAVFRAIASASSPASGFVTLFTKSGDSKLYTRDSSGVEARLDGCFPFVLSVPGPLAVRAGVSGIPVPFACTFEALALRMNTAPTGAAAIFDFNYDGTTIYGTQANRPTVAISGNYATTAGPPSVTSFSGGSHYWSMDCDQIGSTISGSDAVAVLIVRRTGA